jgi:hypothetical protein
VWLQLPDTHHHDVPALLPEVLSQPPPPEVPPPSDPQLRREIDSLAAFVARSGPTVEALARRQARQALAAASAVFSSSSSRDETAQQGTEGLPAHEDGRQSLVGTCLICKGMHQHRIQQSLIEVYFC